ncbi:cupin domain-containing protein [Dankookia sp. GCM10030260]|uniref:cupin domain-containing protein n=1 Tax=Dankookia sp. GCM10030260 TaxID=3273390 RepID=UPI003614E4A3
MRPLLALVLSLAATPLAAQEASLARPQLLLREVVTGMPRGEQQEVQVLTASFRPGDRTVFHTHRHPVTVYVLEGTFTLEMEGRPPALVRAGEALVEPHGVRMTGFNRTQGPLRVVIVYVSEPGMPFLDMIHP